MNKLSWGIVIGSLAMSGAVVATTLNDFKEAASRKYCLSIPYEGLRDTCGRKSEEVDDWCKRRQISCEDLNPAGVVNKIENVKRKVSDLKRERDELSSKLSDAKEDGERRAIEDKRKGKENEIYDLEQKIDRWESDLSNERKAVSDRIYNGEHCVGFREEVRRIFSEAKSRAKSESDAEIKPYTDQLISHWESEEAGHETVLGRYKVAVEKCKQLQ